MLLYCNLGQLELEECGSKKTDSLWLRTIRGRDFLVCDQHRGHHGKQTRERLVSRDISRPSEFDESPLANQPS